MKEIILAFFKEIIETPIELYNEAGLQYEFALFLRNKYPKLTVRVEFPVKLIHLVMNEKPIKKEIDVFIINELSKRYIVEFKFPKINSGIPVMLYKATEDILFLEQMKKHKIDGCYSILVTNKKSIYEQSKSKKLLYNIFNDVNPVLKSLKRLQFPNFMQGYDEIELSNSYKIEWKTLDMRNQKWKYYIIEI